jgi:hypothetical protein
MSYRLQGETLWYRSVVGGNPPRYVRLRAREPRSHPGWAWRGRFAGEGERNDLQGHGCDTQLAPYMLVNVTPAPAVPLAPSR